VTLTLIVVLRRNVLVDKFVEAKRTKDEDIIGDVHSLSAGATIAVAAQHDDLVLHGLFLALLHTAYSSHTHFMWQV